MRTIGILIGVLLIGALVWPGWVLGHPVWGPWPKATTNTAIQPPAGQPPAVSNAAPALQPDAGPAVQQPTPTTSQPEPAANKPYVSLNYDETNGDPLTTGQMQLIARYLRIAAPISQASLEAAISQIQQEAVAAHATTFQGQILTLDQHQAWLVWCSDGTQVDPPSDVSLVHEVTLLASNTLGRVWIQVPFAMGVPLRTDDTWKGCNPSFWAVAVH